MPTAARKKIDKVLIYRLASLGDTVVSLPCFHGIRRAYPQAHHSLLTVSPHGKRTSAMSVLRGTGLVDDYFHYRQGTRNIRELMDLRRRVRQRAPDILFYFFARPKSYPMLIRDLAFFWSCGVRRMVGLPFSPRLRHYRYDAQRGLYEHVSAYLARCIRRGASVDVTEPRNWDMCLKSKEYARVDSQLSPVRNESPFLAVAPGTKMPVKDWGFQNWSALMTRLSREYPGTGAVFLGVGEEWQRCEKLSTAWEGPTVNLAGELDVRESACVISRAGLFVGHDSGPMHLASAVQTPSVAIFSARAKPGVWFPFPNGVEHEVLYRPQSCSECGLTEDCPHGKRCIMSIGTGEVARAVNRQVTRYEIL